jgi:hypothetical protein
MPERSKGGGQTKCSPWFFRFGVGRGANDPKTEKFIVIAPVNNNNNNDDDDANNNNNNNTKLLFHVKPFGIKWEE